MIVIFKFYFTMVKLLKTRRMLTMKEKLNVLFCAYGSITDFSVQQNGYVKVARQLDIKPTTVEMLLFLSLIHI